MDLIITICDTAAGETSPYWPGHPATAHWGYADPSLVEGTPERQLAAFQQTLHAIRRRIDLLIALPSGGLDTTRRFKGASLLRDETLRRRPQPGGSV